MTEEPTVVFLIPFASRRVRANWPTACNYLQQTILSIRNSVSQNYRVIIAGNEKPELEGGFDSKVHFLSVNNQFPSHPDTPTAQRLDKLAKIEAAWTHAKAQWSSKYVMKLDADDLISSKLVEWLDDKGTEGGYLIRHGWVWRSGDRHLIQRTEYFDRVCGSCLIIRTDLADRPGPFLTEAEGIALGPADSSFAMRDHYSLVPGSETTTLLLNDTHQRYAAQFSYLGHELHTLPFDALVYRIGPDGIAGITGDRVHKFSLRMWLGAIRRTRFITQEFRNEFMLG